MRFYDTFCGIGGFHQALTQLGHTCVGASEIDKECCKVYKDNYNIEPVGDITKITEFPDFDILCGGFPCQSVSNAGKKMGRDDPRGKLFDQLIRIAKLKNPSYMFLENVKHIKKIDNGRIFEYIVREIDQAGYFLQTFELSPHHLGIPQNRERIIFACIKKELYIHENGVAFEQINLVIKKKKVNIFEKNVVGYSIKPEEEQILETWDYMIKQFEVGENCSPTILANEFYKEYTPDEFKKLPAWKQEYITKNRRIYEKYQQTWDDWYVEHQEILTKKEIFGKLEWQTGKIKKNDSIFNYFIQFRQSGIRVKKADYFPTLVAIVQTPVYAKERRYITPRECARLQSFPDSFKMHQTDRIAYKQFGNAVNVEVIKTVVSQIIKN
jgi:DNA (cytosine-5)-methyltransferase 1